MTTEHTSRFHHRERDGGCVVDGWAGCAAGAAR
jgi:hypothetical protein